MFDHAHSTRVAYSPRGLAHELSVSHTTVYKWLRDGMPHIRVGAVKRIVLVEALAWLRAREPEGEGGDEA